jgi:hypothetical protein
MLFLGDLEGDADLDAGGALNNGDGAFTGFVGIHGRLGDFDDDGDLEELEVTYVPNGSRRLGCRRNPLDQSMRRTMRIIALVLASLFATAPALAQTIRFYHHDAQGNLIAMTDDQAQVVWRAEPAPFADYTSHPAEHPQRFVDQPQEPHGLGCTTGVSELVSAGKVCRQSSARNRRVGKPSSRQWQRLEMGRQQRRRAASLHETERQEPGCK